MWEVENNGREALDVSLMFTFRNGMETKEDRAGGHWNEPFSLEGGGHCVRGVMLHHCLPVNAYTLAISAREKVRGGHWRWAAGPRLGQRLPAREGAPGAAEEPLHSPPPRCVSWRADLHPAGGGRGVVAARLPLGHRGLSLLSLSLFFPWWTPHSVLFSCTLPSRGQSGEAAVAEGPKVPRHASQARGRGSVPGPRALLCPLCPLERPFRHPPGPAGGSCGLCGRAHSPRTAVSLCHGSSPKSRARSSPNPPLGQ